MSDIGGDRARGFYFRAKAELLREANGGTITCEVLKLWRDAMYALRSAITGYPVDDEKHASTYLSDVRGG